MINTQLILQAVLLSIIIFFSNNLLAQSSSPTVTVTVDVPVSPASGTVVVNTPEPVNSNPASSTVSINNPAPVNTSPLSATVVVTNPFPTNTGNLSETITVIGGGQLIGGTPSTTVSIGTGTSTTTITFGGITATTTVSIDSITPTTTVSLNAGELVSKVVLKTHFGSSTVTITLSKVGAETSSTSITLPKDKVFFFEEGVLEAGTIIFDGVIGGVIRGNAESPVVIESSLIVAGSVLENAIIGKDVILDKNISFGRKVFFESQDNIPDGADLSGVFLEIDQKLSGSSLLNLRKTLFADTAVTFFESLETFFLESEAGSIINLDEETGNLNIKSTEFLTKLVPAKVVQGLSGVDQGISVTEDGDIVVTNNRGQQLIAYPQLNGESVVREKLAKLGLELEIEINSRLIISPSAENSKVNFSARPDSVAINSLEGLKPGLYFEKSQQVADIPQAFIVFEDDEGESRKQKLVSFPAQWEELKNRLLSLGIPGVRIDSEGVIHMNLGGKIVKAIADYTVINDSTLSGAKHLQLQAIGDKNKDGTQDYLIIFPNNDTQVLYVFP